MVPFNFERAPGFTHDKKTVGVEASEDAGTAVAELSVQDGGCDEPPCVTTIVVTQGSRHFPLYVRIVAQSQDAGDKK